MSEEPIDPDTFYQYTVVPIPLIAHIWDKIEPLIQDVIHKAPDDLNADACLESLLSFKSILVTVTRGNNLIAINTLRIQTLESGKKSLYIPITSGTELDEWMPGFLELAERIGRDHGATELRGLASRKGWMTKLKPFGWEEVFTTIRYNFGD